MFVVLLTYIQPLEQIEALLAEHIEFLDRQYAAGSFIASGRRVPRTGGVILARGEEQAALERILAQDPFQREGVASYDIYPFVPSKMQPGFELFL
ncbi:YciI family protein [Bowmanella denitrificans]|uniref:YciI family protein n=1 Tax=Bowmanella denitrificans TaxID=366582 RepID=A0ABN0XXL2_9ALTE